MKLVIVSYSRLSLITFALAYQFHFYLLFYIVLNMKALVGTFNKEKALVGAFSMIVKLHVIFENLRLKLYRLLRCGGANYCYH